MIKFKLKENKIHELFILKRFIEDYTQAKQRFVALENGKSDVESMHALLKKLDISIIKQDDQIKLEAIQSQCVELSSKIADAQLYIKDKKPEMIQKLDKAVQDLQKDITYFFF